VSAIDPLDRFLVVSGPEQALSVEVHEDGLIESVTARHVRVFEKRPDALVELHGEEKRAALAEFWDSVDAFGDEFEEDDE
jgi:hypothetical protein